jgi:nicotinamide N-methyltransferase
VLSEFKEAFPAGRFRPVCHVQAGRGATPSAVADAISAPEWWNSTRIIQAFDEVLRARTRPPSFLRRIASLGTPLRAPALSRAELAAQTVIRRRARAFVDAQDELQSRIGRLSRRLNFLMGEADAWRDKFVTFEAYAERLATEASELRAKVQKEQKDARRMSALNAAEKTQLQSKLRETEEAQRKAAIEVAEMREQMRGLEEEREAMIKEVEAQIETAIQAMAVGVDAPGEELDFDSGDEQAGGEAWRRIKSRKNSIASLKKIKSSGHLRSFPTDTTLSEFPPMPVRQKESMESEQSTKASLDKRVDDQDEAAVNLKRFSALANDEDGMVAVDAGIMQSSDRIAQKVQQIQQKVQI